MSKKLIGSYGLIELSQSVWGYDIEQVEKHLTQLGDRVHAQRLTIDSQAVKIKELESRVSTLQTRNTSQEKELSEREATIQTLLHEKAVQKRMADAAHRELASLRSFVEESQRKADMILNKIDKSVQKKIQNDLSSKARIIKRVNGKTPLANQLTVKLPVKQGKVLSPDLRRFMKEVSDVGRKYLFDASMLTYYFDTLGYDLGREKCIFQLAFKLGAISALDGGEPISKRQSQARDILEKSCILQESVINEFLQSYIPYL